MKAVVKVAPGEGHVELKEWPEPFPQPGEVKLKVAAAGICGTDIHIIKGRWLCQPPVVLGHEFCGTVAEVGAQVRGFRPGDRVVAANPARTCGLCHHCRSGNPFMCPERVSAGYMIDGAFAEYICIGAGQCHHLPDNVSFRQAASGEPLSVAVRAVIERTSVHTGDLVLVSGPGCIGLLTMMIAKLEGAKVIVAGIEKDTRRLQLALSLGAEVVVNVSGENVREVVKSLSDGDGADLVYECAGAVESLDACLDSVRKGGTVVQAGVYPGRIETDLNRVMMKELRFIGTYGYVWTTWQRSIKLLSEGKVNTEAIISHEFSIEDFDEAFSVTQQSCAAKVILNPGINGKDAK
jgi:L-iditol 2-dehydrogenase